MGGPLYGKLDDSDLQAVLKGAHLSNNNSSILHTLGCVYAELGKTKEAREVLIQSMDAADLDEPNPDYWYAFGRIAEQYGEIQTAIADYNRVSKPEFAPALPYSSYVLAQMRLQVLRREQH